MSDTETLELPSPVYQSLLDAAQENGQTPAGWIAAHLRPRLHRTPHNRRSRTESSTVDDDLLAAVLSPTELATLHDRRQGA